MSATDFLATVDAEVAEHVRDNDFVVLARDGERGISREQLQRFALAEFQCQEAEFAAYGLLLSRFHHEVPGGFFSFVGHELMQARHRMVSGAAGAVGLDPDTMRVAPIAPPIRQFTEFISWVAMHAGPAEAALMARTDFTLWCASCKELADATRERDDVPVEIVAYLDAYRDNPPEVADGIREVVRYGLDNGEREEWITRSAPRMIPVLRAWWHYVVTGEDSGEACA